MSCSTSFVGAASHYPLLILGVIRLECVLVPGYARCAMHGGEAANQDELLLSAGQSEPALFVPADCAWTHASAVQEKSIALAEAPSRAFRSP